MIITRSPLRMEFAGGSTDISNFYTRHIGHTLNATINKYIYVLLNKRNDKKISVLTPIGKQLTNSISNIQHPIVRGALQLTKIQSGLDVSVFSDLSLTGTGLGSSSAMAVGLLKAFSAFKGEKISQFDLAELACQLEIDLLQSPIGKQDQYAAVFGGILLSKYTRNGSVIPKHLNITSRQRKNINRHLLVFYTGSQHSSSDILSKQNDLLVRNYPNLVKLSNIVIPTSKALEKDDLKRFGEYLEQEWAIKKKLNKSISNSTIELMYKKAIEAGAWGGRLSGAGGGGFLCLVAPVESHIRIAQALSKFKLFDIKISGKWCSRLS